MKNEFLCGGDWIRIRGERQDNAADRERLPLDRGSEAAGQRKGFPWTGACEAAGQRKGFPWTGEAVSPKD